MPIELYESIDYAFMNPLGLPRIRHSFAVKTSLTLVFRFGILGGDGTQEICSALDTAGFPSMPVIGVPSGVEMHSGSCSLSRAAAEVLSRDLAIFSYPVLRY